MRATCPTCETAYTIPDDRIGPKGRKVRCTKCGDEWRVFAATEPAPVAPPRPEVAAVEPPPPPRRAPEPDPFDDLDDFDAAPPAPEPVARIEPVVAAAAPPPEPAADVDAVEPPAPTPAPPRTPLPGRIRIRTRPGMPRAGSRALAALGTHVKRFIGPAVFVAAALMVTGTIVYRHAIVSMAPDLAGFYASIGLPVNLRGLVFGRIETLRELDAGQPVLVVEGSISNVSHQLREVPALRLALRGSDSQELYAWSIDPKSTSIESGDTIRFRTRLAAPPDQATEVLVRFVERRAQQAGLP